MRILNLFSFTNDGVCLLKGRHLFLCLVNWLDFLWVILYLRYSNWNPFSITTSDRTTLAHLTGVFLFLYMIALSVLWNHFPEHHSLKFGYFDRDRLGLTPFYILNWEMCVRAGWSIINSYCHGGSYDTWVLWSTNAFPLFGCPFDFVSLGLWRSSIIIGSAGQIEGFNLSGPFTVDTTQQRCQWCSY